MSWYSTYWQIPTCTDIRQVYRILAVYWHVLTKNEYILVCTAVQVSIQPFLLESYTPDVGQYSSVSVGICQYVLYHDISWYGMYSLVPCHGAHKIRLPLKMMYLYVPVHTSIYLYVLICTSTYKYVLVCTGMYRYLLIHTSMYCNVLVCTGMYWYELVCTDLCGHSLRV